MTRSRDPEVRVAEQAASVFCLEAQRLVEKAGLDPAQVVSALESATIHVIARHYGPREAVESLQSQLDFFRRAVERNLN